MKTICDEDVNGLGEIFARLKKFHDDWKDREDDPEDMWTEAPEMVEVLVSKMRPIMKRLVASNEQEASDRLADMLAGKR